MDSNSHGSDWKFAIGSSDSGAIATEMAKTEFNRLGPLNQVHIGPFSVAALSENELVDIVVDRYRQVRGETLEIFPVNAQLYVMACRDRTFRECLAKAGVLCADGVPIVWACKWIAKKAVSRVAGVDLLETICASAAKHGLPVFFLGGRPGMAQASAEMLVARYPGLRIAGISCPPFGFDSTETGLAAVQDEIRSVSPAIVFVALGAPRQELFIQRYIRPLGVPVAMAVGGSFEMIAGAVPRAPQWMRNVGLEWLFRFAQEPRRLARRYLVGNTVCLGLILLHKVKLGWRAASPGGDAQERVSEIG
jgi:N-acetylglucosaminyldiphosphoundecaprenol N-acetyl-beta-D-mannosaminyltransferase